jgi:hypothetical protein
LILDKKEVSKIPMVTLFMLVVVPSILMPVVLYAAALSSASFSTVDSTYNLIYLNGRSILIGR